MRHIARISFRGAAAGQWRVTSQRAWRGDPLPPVAAIGVAASHLPGVDTADTPWVLRGTSNHQRYTHRREADALTARKALLDRPEATAAALIPIRKTESWWALAQDERRHIMEERSRHISGTLQYLPAIARKLYDCRDLAEPFDFLTWFEFAPRDAALFDDLVAGLRESPEWDYVDREVDIRLERHA
jgi:hypothetical protein